MKSVTFNGWELYPGRVLEPAKRIDYRIRKVGRSWCVFQWLPEPYGNCWARTGSFTTWDKAMLYLDRRIRYVHGNRRAT